MPLKPNPGNRTPKTDWKGLHAQAGDVLGPDFWQDIAGLLPLSGPRIDMYETGSEVVVVVEVPGLLSSEHVLLSIREHFLVIRGTLVRPYQVVDEQMLLSERFFGAFERRIRLPDTTLTERMQAQYHNGLLIIRIPTGPAAGETPVPIQFT